MLIKFTNDMINKIAYKLMWLDYKNNNMSLDSDKISATEKIGCTYTTRLYDLEEILELTELNLKELFEKIDPNLKEKLNYDSNNKDVINLIMTIKRGYREKACAVISSMGFLATIAAFLISEIIDIAIKIRN